MTKLINALARLADLGYPFYYRIVATPNQIELKVTYKHSPSSTTTSEDNYVVSNTATTQERLTKNVNKIITTYKKKF